MDKSRAGKAAVWCGRVLGTLCLVCTVLLLAATAYFAATNILFLLQVGMLPFSGLVCATVLTALDLTAALLTLRYAWYCLRFGMRDARVLALFPTFCLAMALHLFYIVLSIVPAYIPPLEDATVLALQNAFSVLIPILLDLGVMIVTAAVADGFRGRAKKSGAQTAPQAPAGPTAATAAETAVTAATVETAAPAAGPTDRPKRPSVLWRQLKGPALWSILAAVSIAYIFSGEHSMVSAQTDAFQQFTAAELTGDTVDQTIFADHDLTLVNIWATFCGPCLNEMPALASLHEEYRDRGFQVVGICADIVDPQTGALYPDLLQKALVLEQQTGATVYRDLNPAGDLMQNYVQPYVTAYPTSIFVNAQGEQVGDMIVGSRDEASWREEIEARLAMVDAGA